MKEIINMFKIMSEIVQNLNVANFSSFKLSFIHLAETVFLNILIFEVT